MHCSEYGTSGEVSTCSDVYSFGITLLEIFVGKAPTDEAFKDGLTLPEFVSEAFPDKMEQILDLALLLDEALFGGVAPSSEESELRVTAYDCLVSAVRVGLSCCRQAPCQRMAMRDAACGAVLDQRCLCPCLWSVRFRESKLRPPCLAKRATVRTACFEFLSVILQ